MARRIFAALLLFATIAVAAGCKRASALPPNVSRLLAELRSSFSNGALEFAFSIWNANDPECCPTGGQVVGTYKIIKETGASSGWGMLEPESGAIIRSKPPTRAPTTTLKMVVDTAVREPMPRPVTRTQ